MVDPSVWSDFLKLTGDQEGVITEGGMQRTTCFGGDFSKIAFGLSKIGLLGHMFLFFIGFWKANPRRYLSFTSLTLNLYLEGGGNTIDILVHIVTES